MWSFLLHKRSVYTNNVSKKIIIQDYSSYRQTAKHIKLYEKSYKIHACVHVCYIAQVVLYKLTEKIRSPSSAYRNALQILFITQNFLCMVMRKLKM